MMDREAFKQWWSRLAPNHHMYDQLSAWIAWQARQPEIDALTEAAKEVIREFDLSCREYACYGSVERIEALRSELRKVSP